MVYVQVVAHRGRALVEVSILDRSPGGATYPLEGNPVLMRRGLDRVAADLAQRLGGHAFLTDPAP